MKIILNLLLFIGFLSLGMPDSASAKSKTFAGSLAATNNGQPCTLNYSVTITYTVCAGLPPICIQSVSGTLTGCGVNINFNSSVVYNNGNPYGQDPNGQNIITSTTWIQVSDPTVLGYLNSNEIETPWCNELNNVIVPEILNSDD